MKAMNFKLFLGLMCIGSTLMAQFTMSGEFRPRSEYRHGFRVVPATDAKATFFTDQRSRLNLNFKTETYKTKLVLQDIRTFGAVPQLNTTDGMTSVHEAWGEAKLFGNFSLRAGRQEISLDDQRIFGAVGWAQQARSHDGIVFKYELDSGRTVINVGATYNQDAPTLFNTAYSQIAGYKSFQYLWFHKKMTNVNVSFLFLNNGIQVTKSNGDFYDNYSHTIGTYITFKKGKIFGTLSAYYQAGAAGDTLNTSISAYDAYAELGYKATDRLTAIVGAEMLSGQSQVELANDVSGDYAKTNRSFSPFYGTNHKFNGFMDFFYVGNHFGSVGLNDAYVKFKYKAKKFGLGADVHFFMTGADVLDLNPALTEPTAMNANLGTEIDLSLSTKLTEGVALKAGYSQLFASTTLTTLRGGGDISETINWGYVMVIFKPTFISGK